MSSPPPTPASSSALALMTCPAPPPWHNLRLPEGLQLKWRPSQPFTQTWDEGPQHHHELKSSPYTPETLCRRLFDIAPKSRVYGNHRGVWLSCLDQQWTWYLKSGRTSLASSGLLAKMLSSGLQLLDALKGDRSRIVEIETNSDLTAHEKVCQMIGVVDHRFIAKDRASTLITLQRFRWEDGQTAFQLWRAMYTARLDDDEFVHVLCEQYLANIHAVYSAEERRGVSGASPSPRWTLAIHILELVEALLTVQDPGLADLEHINYVLEVDRRNAHTPLPPVGRAPRSQPQDVFVADLEERELESDVRQMHVSDVLAVQSAAQANRRDYRGHKGVPGCADLKYIVSTGKIYPKDWLQFGEFNPERSDGRVTHHKCPGCQTHNPPVTHTFEYREIFALNGNHPPSRDASKNKGSRTLQPHEVVSHYLGRCFDVWDDIWRFVREHPDDPDAVRFSTPLTDRELQDRLSAHRNAVKARG